MAGGSERENAENGRATWSSYQASVGAREAYAAIRTLCDVLCRYLLYSELVGTKCRQVVGPVCGGRNSTVGRVQARNRLQRD